MIIHSVYIMFMINNIFIRINNRKLQLYSEVKSKLRKII